MKNTIPNNHYTLTINGHTYETLFTYHDIKPISETFKNVSWRLVQ